MSKITDMARKWAEDDKVIDTKGFLRSMEMLDNKHKIYYIMGKSASGKDTVYREILKRMDSLRPILMHTTRPMRKDEADGVQYAFDTDSAFRMMLANNYIAEYRRYAVSGSDVDWIYFTPISELDTLEGSRIGIGTLESYDQLYPKYGNKLVPIYIYVDDTTRFLRAVERELHESKPNPSELCRRFLADEQDYSELNLQNAGLCVRFENTNLTECVDAICKYIQHMEER